MKRLQNRVSQSRLLLPVVVLYAVAVWLLAGGIQQGWYVQLACFTLSTYLMVEVNNAHALLRIYSRMVSSSFVVLMCCATSLFASAHEAVMLLFIIAAMHIALYSYQDKQAVGIVYYSALCFGLASMAYVHVLCLLPLVWLFMAFSLQNLSWRTFGASLLGLLTPYWLAACWLLWQGDLLVLTDHFASLVTTVCNPFDLSLLAPHQLAFYVFMAILVLTGTIHFLRQNYHDSIRIRMFYDMFIWTSWLMLLLIAVQPCHYGALMHILIVAASPLAAHFVALTSTRTTNVAFMVICGCALLLTAYSLWMSSFTS